MFLIALLVLFVALLVVTTNYLKLHPFLALLFVAIGYGLLAGMPPSKVAASVTEGFGATAGKIGILIIAGTIIGTFLERSGGAFALADRIIRAIGEHRVPLAIGFMGWVVSIPVFADSGFVILSSLNRALSKKAKVTLAVSAISLALGLMSSHCLVPPTPGPVAAAGILQADLGLVILLGVPFSFFSFLVGWLWATRMGSRVMIEANPDMSDEQIAEKVRNAPSPSVSILPIIAPILLIVMKSVADLPGRPLGQGAAASFFRFVGEPSIALLIGVLLAFLLPKVFDREMMSTSGWVGQAMFSAATITFITAAGGSFGKVLEDSGIAKVLGDTLAGAHLGIWLPFFLAAAIKTAQGSSTVAIITTSSLVLPLLGSLGFDAPLARAFVAIAIGAGSMVASHINDSFFWVVTQMSGMDVSTGYRLHTAGSAVMGLATAALIWVVSLAVL